MNRLALAIIGSVVAMFTVLVIFDLKQVVVTPLAQYGVNHWIPEALAIFLIGRWLTSRTNKTLLPVVTGCLFLYPILTYTLMNQLTFGIGTSSVFVAVFLMGVWSNRKQNREEVR